MASRSTGLRVADFGGATLAVKGRIDTEAQSPRGAITLDLNARALDGITTRWSRRLRRRWRKNCAARPATDPGDVARVAGGGSRRCAKLRTTAAAALQGGRARRRVPSRAAGRCHRREPAPSRSTDPRTAEIRQREVDRPARDRRRAAACSNSPSSTAGSRRRSSRAGCTCRAERSARRPALRSTVS